MAYLGNSPGVASQRVETALTATAAQTVFTPSSGYTLGYCDVYQNGVKLVNGDDYTAADGATVTLTTGAASGDSIVIVASFPRGLSDGYLKSEADAKYVAKAGDTMTGDLVLDNGNADGAQLQLASSGYSAWNWDNYSGRLRAYYGSTEYFTIDSSGNVGIGVTPSAWSVFKALQLGSTMALGGVNNTSANMFANTYYDGAYKYIGTGGAYRYEQNVATGYHAWHTAGSGTAGNTITFTERMRIDSSGNLSLATGNLVLASGKGIDFSANSNASGMTSEVLDDYEHGTWTPVPVVNYGTGSITGYNSSGTYTKIGNMVHIKFEIRYITWTGSPVNMGVNGLPFTLNAASENYSSGIAQNLSTGIMYQLEMTPGAASVNVIRRYDNGTAFTNQNVGFDGSATYFV